MKKPSKKQTQPETGRRRQPEKPTESRPQAFSYHANRSSSRDNTATRETVVAKPAVDRRWWFMLAGLVAVLILVSIQSTTPAIKTAGSTDSKRLLQADSVYQTAVSQDLGGSLTNHIKYAVDTEALGKNLRNKFPELTAVTVTETLFSNRPVVTVAGYEPSLIVSSADGSYVVDEDGVSRVTSARLPDSVRANLPLVADQSGISLEPGSAVLPANHVEFINQIVAGLKAANVGYEQLTLPAASSELHVKITGQTYFVKFALQGGASARQQLGTFLAAQSKVAGASYVDARVPERLYYK